MSLHAVRIVARATSGVREPNILCALVRCARDEDSLSKPAYPHDGAGPGRSLPSGPRMPTVPTWHSRGFHLGESQGGQDCHGGKGAAYSLLAPRTKRWRCLEPLLPGQAAVKCSHKSAARLTGNNDDVAAALEEFGFAERFADQRLEDIELLGDQIQPAAGGEQVLRALDEEASD